MGSLFSRTSLDFRDVTPERLSKLLQQNRICKLGADVVIDVTEFRVAVWFVYNILMEKSLGGYFPRRQEGRIEWVERRNKVRSGIGSINIATLTIVATDDSFDASHFI